MRGGLRGRRFAGDSTTKFCDRSHAAGSAASIKGVAPRSGGRWSGISGGWPRAVVVDPTTISSVPLFFESGHFLAVFRVWKSFGDNFE